jgi:hypothetical protein
MLTEQLCGDFFSSGKRDATATHPATFTAEYFFAIPESIFN